MSGNGDAAWFVTTQMETQRLDPSGAFVQGVQVSFRTAEGATGSVFVPRADFNVEKVRAMVAAAAAEVSAVANLRG